MRGLQVLRFDPKKVMAHEKVIRFYNSMSSENSSGGSREDEFEASAGEEEMMWPLSRCYRLLHWLILLSLYILLLVC